MIMPLMQVTKENRPLKALVRHFDERSEEKSPARIGDLSSLRSSR